MRVIKSLVGVVNPHHDCRKDERFSVGRFLGETPKDDPVKMTLCWHAEAWVQGGPTPDGEPSDVRLHLLSDCDEYHGVCPDCGRRLWAAAVVSAR